ncbi:MAG: flagellar hook-length control protein FliK, partial [Hydrogenophaga sp.]|nr:flagellar hook-length control protein FliK [Hydrogenophaga sp.]
AGDEAIDIRLSLAGQAVQVDFLTDSAEVRTSLQQHAGEALAHLLQRSGMQLGGVSVGAQGQGSGTDPRGSERPRHPGRTAGVGGPAAAAAEPTRRTGMASPRADGSQPLDVFA